MLPKAALICVGISLNLCIISIPLLFREGGMMVWLAPNSLIFGILMSAFCITEIWSGTSENDNTFSGVISYLPHLIGFVFLSLIWVSVFQTQTHQFSWQMSAIGCLTMIAGIALRAISIKTLKNQFLSQIQLRADHTLITSGIYALIRHPSELGLLLIGLGIPLLLSSFLGLLVFAIILTPLSLYRISREDKLLLDTFTQDFSIYKDTTPALVPKLHPKGGHYG